MRLSLAVVFIAASTGAAFAPSGQWGIQSRRASVAKGPLFSTVEADTETSVGVVAEANGEVSHSASLTAAEINARMEKQMEKLQKKDSSSPQLSKEVSQKIFSGRRAFFAPCLNLSYSHISWCMLYLLLL
jgi:hypothetical protein